MFIIGQIAERFSNWDHFDGMNLPFPKQCQQQKNGRERHLINAWLINHRYTAGAHEQGESLLVMAIGTNKKSIKYRYNRFLIYINDQIGQN